MALAAKLDEYGKGGWIAAMVLGFWFFWPVGLATLAFLAWSGRFRAWKHGGAPGRWYNAEQAGPGAGNGAAPGWASRGWRCGASASAPPSGNRAFDEYRAETLRRLEEEQREFVNYLERLRQARDKAEFDQFMDERRARPPAPPTTTETR